LVVAACASPGKSEQTSERTDTASSEVAGPPSPTGTNPNGGEIYGPHPGAPTQIENPDRIVLILGPGLTHGYSYVGVIKALSELKIPIHAIYGTEVGALVGALYFTQPNPNRIDWALLRFTENNLRRPDGKLALLNLKSPEANLEAKLREIFGDKRVEAYADRLHIQLEDAKTGEKIEAKSGDLWRAIRGALAGKNGFSPTDFEGRSVKASSRKLSDEYRLARQVEGHPIVVAVAGNPPSELFRKLIEAQKSTLLYIPLPGIDDLDLKRRNQAVFSGKSAVHQAANELLGLVGRKLE
jgi:hypothetical protein